MLSRVHSEDICLSIGLPSRDFWKGGAAELRLT
jgi:hypothetical protein